MKDDIKILKEKFQKIHNMGWIKFNKLNCGTIGTTFEKLIGINTNELEIPDFGSIEIKTKTKSKYKFISLFNCVPTGPHYHEVEIIKDSFGYPDTKLKKFKVLNGEVFCNKLTKIGNNFYFKLNIYRKEEKIKLCVYDNKRNKIEESTYWDLEILKEKINRKLSYLALVNVDKKKINGLTFFKYHNINFYKLKSFNTFVNLLENGIIKITFRIGIFKEGKRIGKIHDRGTVFSIEEQNINKLFEQIK